MLHAARAPRAARLPGVAALSLAATLAFAGCAVTSGTAHAREAAEPNLQASTDQAATNPALLDQAALLASVCSGCHHAGGTAIADLSTKSAAQIELSLRTYRQAADGPTAMHRMARGYTDAEIAAIARRLGR